MKPESIYNELKELAGKLDLIISEENLKTAGLAVKSGLCKLKGKHVFIIDKHQSVHRRIELLAECLSGMNHESVFVIPAVRELLNRHKPARKSTHTAGDDHDHK